LNSPPTRLHATRPPTHQQNVLAVGLGASVYLWSACTSKVTRLADLGDGAAVCSVAWSGRGAYLAVGTDRGEVQIWDAARGARVRALAGHKQRVGVMAWGGGALATGSRDRAVLLRDVRAPDAYTARLGAHRSEVCGLKWSPDERELASGGNDNQLLVWAPAGATAPGAGGSGAAGRAAAAALAPIRRFAAHTAAVKAIAWSPHQHGLLASGGGTADRCIRFWSSSTGAALSAVDTGSQARVFGCGFYCIFNLCLLSSLPKPQP
jgi:cell division cycle 20-like protein 1 (cofactor of APC complex)